MKLYKRRLKPRERSEKIEHNEEPPLTRKEVKDILRQGLQYVKSLRNMSEKEYRKRLREIEDDDYEDDDENDD